MSARSPLFNSQWTTWSWAIICSIWSIWYLVNSFTWAHRRPTLFLSIGSNQNRLITWCFIVSSTWATTSCGPRAHLHMSSSQTGMPRMSHFLTRMNRSSPSYPRAMPDASTTNTYKLACIHRHTSNWTTNSRDTYQLTWNVPRSELC
jgi:hypothetical protein